jgi:hypothetical protein
MYKKERKKYVMAEIIKFEKLNLDEKQRQDLVNKIKSSIERIRELK